MPTYAPSQRMDVFERIIQIQNRTAVAVEVLRAQRRKFAYVNPTLLNAWEQPGDPYHDLQWRITGERTLEFRGHVTNGDTDTAVINLPLPLLALCSIDKNVSWLSDINTNQAARWEIDYTTGDVIISFPIT